jgi:hypothetical protein
VRTSGTRAHGTDGGTDACSEREREVGDRSFGAVIA